MVATLCVHAQDEDELVNEVGISYGIVANSNFLDVYTESISGKSGTYFGPLALEYFHHLTPMISVGGVGVCKSHKETINGIELTTRRRLSAIPYLPLRESKRAPRTRKRAEPSTFRCQPSVLK